jgi:regulator of sigma E protease
MSILIFLAVLFLLVLVHEWGHYITAKLTGMRVDEFGIGFPPKLFGIKKGETEYTINALPIGGFVKIFGEDGISDPSVGRGEVSRSFIGKNRFAQALVLVAGVTMNVLFAWFLFTLAFIGGVERAIPENEAGPESRLIVTDVLPKGPAHEALLPPGAIITAVTRGEAILSPLTPSSFSAFVSEGGEEPVHIAYQKGEEMFVANIVPKAGTIEAEPERPAVGVALALIDTVTYSVGDAIGEGFRRTYEGLGAITVGLGSLLRDAVVGKADLTQVAGPVGLVGLVGEASSFGFTSLLMFTAFISLNLAVINLLPFPALDGGRLVFVILEGVTRRTIPARVTQILNTVGFGLLILLMLVVTFHDISKLF